jgi:hypothetical protein
MTTYCRSSSSFTKAHSAPGARAIECAGFKTSFGSGFFILQSQRVLQPRVGELASLPWVGRRLNPERVPPQIFFARLTGYLTPPNGSNFCKLLKTRKVYGLTAKTPPGRPCQTGQTPSNPVKPGQAQSNQIKPGPPFYTPPSTLVR